jgi:Chlorophyll A-B binding protein
MITSSKIAIALCTNTQRNKFILLGSTLFCLSCDRAIEQLLTNCFTKLNLSVTLIKDSQTTFRRNAMRSGMQMDEAGKLNVFAVEPKMYVSEDSQFGFNVNSERLNGRLAMIGFVSLLIMEVVTGHGLVGFFTSL